MSLESREASGAAGAESRPAPGARAAAADGAPVARPPAAPPRRAGTPRRTGFARLPERWRSHVDPAWLDGWRPASFPLEGGVTEVVAMGRGPTVVLLPPVPGVKEAWLACAAPLARRFRVVTFDLRVRYRGRPRWDAVLADMERILDVHAPGPAAVVGHSLGGALAQRWALAHPERVRALVLSSTFTRAANPPGQWRARYLEQPLVVASQRFLPAGAARRLARRLAADESWVYDRSCTDHVLEFVRFCIRSLPLGDAASCLALAFDHDTRTTAAAIACPTLIVVGEKDTALARAAAQELRRSIAGSRLAVSPGVGHLHPFSGAAWLVDTVASWLAPRLEPAPPAPAAG